MRDSAEYLQQTERVALKNGVLQIYGLKPIPMGPIIGVDPDVEKAIRKPPTTTPTRQTVQLYDPGRDTVAQDYQEGKTWPLRAADIPGVNGAIELARFSAVENQIGVVHGCWVYVETERPTQQFYSGGAFDPFSFVKNGVELRFILRLVQRPPNTETPQFIGPPQDIPRYGFPGLPYWEENRFPVGTGADIFWIVPDGFDLRLFVHVLVMPAKPVTYMMGRMWGYNQPMRRTDVVWNMRHGWQW